VGAIISLKGIFGSAHNILLMSTADNNIGWPPFPFFIGEDVEFKEINLEIVALENPGLSIGTTIVLKFLEKLSLRCLNPT